MPMEPLNFENHHFIMKFIIAVHTNVSFFTWQKFAMCSSLPEEGEVDPTIPAGHAGAAIARKKIWKGREKLRVYFINPEDIDTWGWKCRGEPINSNNVFAWAKVWNYVQNQKIPTFEYAERAPNADIRVKFSSNRMYLSCLKFYIVFIS